jgi:mannosyltransferase
MSDPADCAINLAARNQSASRSAYMRTPTTNTMRNRNPYVSRRRPQRVEVAGRKITKHGIALLVIILIGAFLRVYHLGTQSLWVDEAFSVWISKLAVPQVVQVTAVDVHPPLYYVCLHYWMMVFGTSESVVRLLSALFGVLSIPMIYVIGRYLFNEEAGLVGALILALSSFNIYYSQEARMYGLMALLALLSMYFFLLFLQRGTLASSSGYVLSTTLLVYTHNYGWFVIIAQNIYVITLLLLSRDRACSLKRWVQLQAVVFTLFIPWAVILIGQISRLEGAGPGLATPTTATIMHTFVTYSGTAVLLALFLGLSALSLFAYRKVRGAMDWKAPLKTLESYTWQVRLQDPTPVYFLVVWLIAVNLIPFVISRFSAPLYVERYTIAASMALYVLVAKGTTNIRHRYIKLAVMGIIVVLSVATLQVYYTSIAKVQGRDATALIDANAFSGDVVLLSPDYHHFVFDYYNNRTDIAVKPLQSWAVTDKETNVTATPSTIRPEDKIKEIQSDVNGRDRVWLYVARLTDNSAADNFTFNILNESYTNVHKQSYNAAGNIDVYLFERRA